MASRVANITKRVLELRKLMTKHKVDAYYVPSADAHQSEYVADCDKRRAFISGFTGSAGTAVITQTQAFVWTDGRYFLQGESELGDEKDHKSLWKLMKAGLRETPSIEDWLAKNLSSGQSVGLDPFVTSTATFQRLETAFKEKKVNITPVTENLVDTVWGSDRPARSTRPVIVHPLKFSGEDTKSKVEKLRKKLAEQGAAGFVVTALDEIAWLFNLRGDDVAFNPVFFSYATITDKALTLYIDNKKITAEAKVHLEASNTVIRPYDSLLTDIGTLVSSLSKEDGKDKKKIWLDPQRSNLAIFQAVPSTLLLSKESPIQLPKAVKNETELAGLRESHLRDAVAVIKYLHWLEKVFAKNSEIKLDAPLTEVTGADKLESFRAEQKDYVGLSFDTISSSGPNGAIIHYKPERETCRPLSTKELILLDSGAQYRDGTTDITRTFHLGIPTDFEKEAFTRVLQGHIGLASAIFPPGTTGIHLDSFARLPLWKAGLEYRHGTGHGVGSYLNVHEGPHGLSASTYQSSVLTTPFEVGMTITNEPGYYHNGSFGCRIESVCLVKNVDTAHQFEGRQFMGLETITMVPIQKKMFDLKILTKSEIDWINEFHADCWKKVSPLVKDKELLSWLQEATQPVSTSA